MIKINAKISLLSTNDGTLSSVSSNIANTSNSSNIEAIMGVKRETKNVFMLGTSKIGDGSEFSPMPNYFIGMQKATSNGKFNTPYVISVSGTSIKAITIAFDTTNNAFPSSIKVNNELYIDNDSIYTIKLPTATDSVEIVIDNWNRPNYPIVISGIYVNIDIQINNKNLKYIEPSVFDRADIKLPSYGIISNSGRIEFNDFGEVEDYANQGLLVSGLTATINLVNTLTQGNKQIGTFFTDEWNYDNDSKSVSVSLKDDLEEWQEINVEAISYNPKTQTPKTFDWFYSYLYNITIKYGYNIQSYYDLDYRTQNILSQNKVQYALLKSDNLWKQWTKICVALRCVIYKENGIIKFKYVG